MAVGEGDMGFVEVVDEVFVVREETVSGCTASNVLAADFSVSLS